MAIWPLTFEGVNKISTTVGRLIGSCPTTTSKNTLWWIKNIFWPPFSILYFYLSLHTVIFYNIKDEKYGDAIRCGTVSIVSVTIAIKHILLLRYQKSLQNIIRGMEEDYDTAKDFEEEEKEIILKYSQMGTNICKFWLISAFCTGWMFPIRAVLVMGYSYFRGNFQLVPILDFSYPFINEYTEIPFIFWILFISCFWFSMYAAAVHVAFDPLVPTILTHTCGQLELICRKLLKLLSPENSAEDISEDLKQINIKLIKIYSIVETVQSNFVVLYELIMKSTTFLIPFSLFQIVESINHKDISVEYICFFIASLLHFFSPCYYSNLLMDKSESLREAIYFSRWETYPNPRIRSTIIIMLTRTTKSLVIRTVFMPICLDTFAEMARQAYGIYNIMNAAWG